MDVAISRSSQPRKEKSVVNREYIKIAKSINKQSFEKLQPMSQNSHSIGILTDSQFIQCLKSFSNVSRSDQLSCDQPASIRES